MTQLFSHYPFYSIVSCSHILCGTEGLVCAAGRKYNASRKSIFVLQNVRRL